MQNPQTGRLLTELFSIKAPKHMHCQEAYMCWAHAWLHTCSLELVLELVQAAKAAVDGLSQLS